MYYYLGVCHINASTILYIIFHFVLIKYIMLYGEIYYSVVYYNKTILYLHPLSVNAQTEYIQTMVIKILLYTKNNYNIIEQ